mgnify:CR=1 FL=1
MDFRITKEQLYEWCKIPKRELENHPDSKVKLIVKDDTMETMRFVGNMMADEVVENNKKGKITKWVLPCGPLDQYIFFAERVNREKICLKNLYVFQMDEYLDWEGRHFPEDGFYSFKRRMKDHLYDKIDSELKIPEKNIFSPSIYDIDFMDRKAEEMGGIDTVWAGVGCKGLVAFNESPYSPYYRVTLEQYANSKTRIVDLNEDTIVALSQRNYGCLYDCVPPKAITIGFNIMCAAKKVVFMIREGSWKQTSVRVAMFSEPTTEYPVTLLVNYIKDATLVCDRAATEHPLTELNLEVF